MEQSKAWSEQERRPLAELKRTCPGTRSPISPGLTEKRIYIKHGRRVGGGCGSKEISERREAASTASWKEHHGRDADPTQTDRLQGRTEPEGTCRRTAISWDSLDSTFLLGKMRLTPVLRVL